MPSSSRTILTNAEMILPDRTLRGSVVIEDNRIADISSHRYTDAVDLAGQFLIPGIIDIHSDYIEREIHPRPSAEFPLSLAFHFMDLRAISSGLTTVLSAARFSPKQEDREQPPFGLEFAHQFPILSSQALARHYIHVRWNPVFEPAEELLQKLAGMDCIGNLVYNDWTPGERQFRDLDLLIRNYALRNNVATEEAADFFEKRRAAAKSINNRGKVKAVLAGKIPLGSHDDTTVEHVLEAYEYGASLAEMPVTIEAARKAKELGMLVCMGAPNYYRGGSHCGNLSCLDALTENLVDILCSDYHFPSLLVSVCTMMDAGTAPSEAVKYVSLNPARHLGLSNDLGSIEIGKKADMVAFERREKYAFVSSVWVDGSLRFAAGRGTNVAPERRDQIPYAASTIS